VSFCEREESEREEKEREREKREEERERERNTGFSCSMKATTCFFMVMARSMSS